MRGREVPPGVPEFVNDLISQFEISQTSKIVSQMQFVLMIVWYNSL